MRPELESKFTDIQELLNRSVDANDTREVVGLLVLAVGRLTAIVEELADKIQPD
jgi:hypothetical protein